MSEVAEYRTVIQIPTLAKRVSVGSNLLDADPRSELLKRALEIVLEEHGGTLSGDIRDCDSKQIACLTGIRLGRFPPGDRTERRRKRESGLRLRLPRRQPRTGPENL